MDAVFLLARSLLLGTSDVESPPCEITSYRPQDRAKLRALFSSPLILGASVSANFRTQSPVDRLVRRLDVKTRPTRIAASGATARALVRRIHEPLLARASIVVSVDLFFWDATFPNFATTQEALEKLIQMTSQAEVPLVLSTIPRVTNQIFQWDRERINEALREAAHAHRSRGLLLMDLDEMAKRIRKEGGFQVGRKRFTKEAIAPDGIHLSSAACEFLAEELARITCR
jgi:hypothetical protein